MVLYPVGHRVQAELAGVLEYDPATHRTHAEIALAPATAEYLPARQLVQAGAAADEKLPG